MELLIMIYSNLIVIYATILSIIGYIYVARKNILGFFIWLPANFIWILHFYLIKDFYATGLFTFYFFTSIYGIYKWGK